MKLTTTAPSPGRAPKGGKSVHRLLVLFSRFLPKLVDRIVAKKVRQTYADEIEARERGNSPAPREPSIV